VAERVVLPRATVARAIRVPLAAALPWSFEGCGAGADECGAQGKPRRAQAASPALPRSAADAMRHARGSRAPLHEFRRGRRASRRDGLGAQPSRTREAVVTAKTESASRHDAFFETLLNAAVVTATVFLTFREPQRPCTEKQNS
jgi:hypothetical protein